MNEQDYIANCISRILMAPCHPSQTYRRDKALAEAVRAAALLGEDVAHKYLQGVLASAEAGAYVQAALDVLPAAADESEGE